MWKSVKLEDACQIGDGNHSSNYPKSSEMVGDGIPFLRAGNIQGGTVSDKDLKFLTSEKHEILKKGHLKRGDVLLTNRGEIGKTAIVPEKFDGANLNSQIAWLRPDERLLSAFLYYCLNTPSAIASLTSQRTGTALQQLTIRQIKNFEIPIPPLAEQQRIVAKLDAAFAEIDKAVEAASVQVSNIDMLRQRILNGWIENNANSKDYYTVQDCIDNEWIKPPFDGNHGEIHPKASDYTATGIPFIMARDLSNGGVNLIDCKFISPEQASSLRVGFAENDDILLTHKGTIGEVALLKCEADFVMLTPQVSAYRVIDETRVDRVYLYYLFKSAFFQSQIQQIAGIGTTRAYIGITRQKHLNLCLPPIHLQQEAVRILTFSEPHVSTISSANIRKLEQLSKLKSAILAQELQSEAA